MAHITRCISDDGCVVVLAADTTDIVEYARQINNSSKVLLSTDEISPFNSSDVRIFFMFFISFSYAVLFHM